MNPDSVPIACDLTQLTPVQRQREQALLQSMRTQLTAGVETEKGYRFVVTVEPDSLAAIGEFIALERRCCPFLQFELAAPAPGAAASLHIFGGTGVKEFLARLLVAEVTP
jgi:hypothetical protein